VAAIDAEGVRVRELVQTETVRVDELFRAVRSIIGCANWHASAS